MSALTRYFFSPVYTPRSAWSVVGWWESRRPTYNLAVGVAGLIALGAQTGFGLLPPHPRGPRIPLGAVGIIVYAVLANLCYSAGPLIDLWIRRLWGNRYAAVGPTLFRYGVVFSIGVTLLPIPLAFLNWVARLLHVAG